METWIVLAVVAVAVTGAVWWWELSGRRAEWRERADGNFAGWLRGRYPQPARHRQRR